MYYILEWNAFYTTSYKRNLSVLKKKVLRTTRLSLRMVFIIRFIVFAFRLDLKKNFHKRRWAFVAVINYRSEQMSGVQMSGEQMSGGQMSGEQMSVSKYRSEHLSCEQMSCEQRSGEQMSLWQLLTKTFAHVTFAHQILASKSRVSKCHGTGGTPYIECMEMCGQ